MSRTFGFKRHGLALLAAFSAVAAIAAYTVAGASGAGREAEGSFCTAPVGPGPLCIQLAIDGQVEQGHGGSVPPEPPGLPGEVSVTPGNYWLTVTDNHNGHNFALEGPDGITELTPVANGATTVITRTDKIKLRHGSYSLLCTSTATPPGVPGPGPVHATIGMKIDINVGGEE